MLPYLLNFHFTAAVVKLRELTELLPEARSKSFHRKLLGAAMRMCSALSTAVLRAILDWAELIRGIVLRICTLSTTSNGARKREFHCKCTALRFFRYCVDLKLTGIRQGAHLQEIHFSSSPAILPFNVLLT